jgi:hypothetical protein
MIEEFERERRAKELRTGNERKKSFLLNKKKKKKKRRSEKELRQDKKSKSRSKGQLYEIKQSLKSHGIFLFLCKDLESGLIVFRTREELLNQSPISLISFYESMMQTV